MKKAIISLSLFLLVSSCKNSTSSKSGMQDYQQQKMTVEETEKANPQNFLKANGTYHGNFWGDKMKVHGHVINNATVANYKDVVVRVTFYSNTETVLDSKDYVIYDYFPAHNRKNFELSITMPVACKKLGWVAVTGVPY